MESNTDKLKLRVLQLKSKIPYKINYLSVYEHHFGEQSKAQENRIVSVWNMRIADEAIIINLEHIAEQYSKIKI